MMTTTTTSGRAEHKKIYVGLGMRESAGANPGSIGKSGDVRDNVR
jgi:hypothetical protein